MPVARNLLTISALLIGAHTLSLLPAHAQTVTKPPAIKTSALSHQNARTALDKIAATERAYYIVCMNLIEREWNMNHVARVLELLAETKDSRYRSFEWGYWNRLCHLDRLTLKEHTNGITDVAFSPDGKTLLTTGWDDKTVKIRDAATGKVLFTLPVHPAGITSAAFSPDGKRVVTCSHYEVFVWDIQTGKERLHITKKDFLSPAFFSAMLRAVFSPDGTQIATAGLDGWAKIFDAQTGKEILTIKERSGGSLYAIAFSPDGKTFASCSDDNTATLWDTQTGATLLSLKGHEKQVNDVAFSPDGKRIATGSWDDTARIWDAQTGKLIYTLTGHTGTVKSVTFALDGKSLATSSEDGTAKVWDTASGKEIQALKGHTSKVYALAFSPDSKTLATASEDNTAKIWEVGATNQVNPFPPNTRIRAQGAILTSDEGASRGRRNGFQGTPSKLPFKLSGIGVPERTLSPDCKLVVVPANKNEAQVWEIETGKLLCTLEGHTQPVGAFAFSSDNRRVATGSADNTVIVWEVQTGKRLQILRGHRGEVKTIAFFSEGKRIVTGSADGTARVWNIQTGRELCTLIGHKGSVTQVRVYHNGRYVVSGGEDKAARVWYAATGQLISTLTGQAPAVKNMFSISSDGRRAMTGLNTPILWDTRTGKEVVKLRGLNATYYPGVFSPDGKRIAAGDYNGTIKLYDAESGKETLTLNIPGERVAITSVAFSPDGKCLTTYSGNASPVVWLSDASVGESRP